MYVATPRSRNEIRSLAYQIRKSLGFENRFDFPIMYFLEHIMPEIDSKFYFEIETVEHMGDNHGLTKPDYNKIILREDVYEGACNGKGRDRLTVAHELGHYFLHRDGIYLARSDKTVVTYKDPEWQATAFGGELLVPAKLVKGLTPEVVSRKCLVTLKAATFQLSTIK